MGSRKIARSRPRRGSAQNFAAVLMEATVSVFWGHRLLLLRVFFRCRFFISFAPGGGAAWLVKALKSPGVDTRHETRDKRQDTG